MIVRSALLAAAFVSAAALADPPEFTAVEITSATPEEIAALGHFHRWAPLAVSAPAGYAGVARTRNGMTLGNLTVGGIFLQRYALLADATASMNLLPEGTFNWQRVEPGGDGNHFFNGFVSFLDAYDLNCAGSVVGDTTIDGSGSYASEHITHAVLIAPDGTFTDLTPDAFRAEARAINAAGEIALWSQLPSGQQDAYRRAPSGALTTLDGLGGRTVPRDLTYSGLIVGDGDNGVNPGRSRAFASPAGAACVELYLPGTGPATEAQAVDANESGWIVGSTWNTNQSNEHFANIWLPNGQGWESHDLNELLQTSGILLERAVAIAEDGRIIATGRPDGSDALGSALYVLTPSAAPAVPCVGPGCAVELTGDAIINGQDLAVLIAAWGQAEPDLDGDQIVSGSDLAVLLAAWGEATACD